MTGELIVFHAGSLAVPWRELAQAFEAKYPGVRVLREAAGSRTSARKISDLGRPCDVLGSADYTVIDELLIPEHAAWNIPFATNEMVLAYTLRSRRAGEITPDNWLDVATDRDVVLGRSEPDSDPCGYRTVLTAKLAEKHYGRDRLAVRLLDPERSRIRPKETDLLALLEVGEVDYIYIYRSVAQQHGLEYVTLPDEINLKSPALADLYATVTMEVSGTRPGERLEKHGTPMAYGVTIPKNAPHPELALAFVEFLLSPEGMAIMEKNGQPSLVPAATETFEQIPARLRRYARSP